jgi:hypothetical protein
MGGATHSGVTLTCDCGRSGNIFNAHPGKPETFGSNSAKIPAKPIGWGLTMIRLNDQIRLTRKEIEVFTKITDIEPVGFCTLGDLDAYVARCKAHYWGVSEQTEFVHWLIDREYRQCRQVA